MRLDRTLLGLNLYAILDVVPHATPEQIRRAYRRLATVSHPDLSRDEPARARLPLGRAVGKGFHVNRQPVGHHHEVGHRIGPYGLEPPTTGSVPPVPRTMTRTPV